MRTSKATPTTTSMPDNDANTRQTRIKFWQQNVNRSLVTQLDVLDLAKPSDYDVILLQEPYIDFLGNTRANSHLIVVYPVTIFTFCLDYYTPLPRDLLTCAAALTFFPFYDSYCTILTRLFLSPLCLTHTDS